MGDVILSYQMISNPRKTSLGSMKGAHFGSPNTKTIMAPTHRKRRDRKSSGAIIDSDGLTNIFSVRKAGVSRGYIEGGGRDSDYIRKED